MADDIREPVYGKEADRLRDGLVRARAAEAAVHVAYQPFAGGSGGPRSQKVAIRVTDDPAPETAYGAWIMHVRTCADCAADGGCPAEKQLWDAYKGAREAP